MPISTPEVDASMKSVDGTEKALFLTADGRPVEAVLMRTATAAPFTLPLQPVGLPAHLHLLRHRHDEIRPQPDRVGDPTRPFTSGGSSRSTTPSSWAWASR